MESLPSDWEVLPLGDLCRRGGGDIQTGPFGSQLHASDYVAEGIPSIMPQDIGDNHIVTSGIAHIREQDAQRLSRYRVRSGDIVYSRRGDVERRALIREAEDGWLCGTGCLRVRLGTAANPIYASYYLADPRVRQWIVSHAIGATMPNLSTSVLSALPFVIPPRSEQDRIAEILGALDDKIELNRRMNETLDATARAIFLNWLREVRVLAEYISAGQMIDTGLLSIGDGYRAKNSELSFDGLPFARAGDVDGTVQISSSTQHLSPASVSAAGEKVSRPGDVVITTKGTVGRIARVTPSTPQFVYSPQLSYWRSLDRNLMDSDVLFQWISSPEFREQIDRVSGQTDMAPYVSLRDQREFRLPLVPATEQRHVAAQLQPLLKLEEKCDSESRALSVVRDALLPKLLSRDLPVSRAESVAEVL